MTGTSVDKVMYTVLKCGHPYHLLPFQEHLDSYFCDRCGREQSRMMEISDRYIDPLRRTGRTTRILEMVLSKCGVRMPSCLVLGATENHAKILRDRMLDILSRRGLEDGLTRKESFVLEYMGTEIKFGSMRSCENGKYRGVPVNFPVFSDHYLG